MKLAAIIIFILTYILLLTFPKRRHWISLGVAILFIVLQISPLKASITSTSSWNVILMLIGTMGVVGFFIESKMPNYLADVLIQKMPNVKWAIVSLALFAGIISAFVDNVATVIMVAPVAMTISKKLKISPVPSIIAISISANLQGAATLVGDTTSILLANQANLTFFDFFFLHGRIGIFFVVEVAALATTFILLWLFRKETQKVEIEEKTVVTDFFPSILLVGIIMLLIGASFIKGAPDMINGIICIAMFAIGLIQRLVKNKDKNAIKHSFKDIDYQTLILLFGLFIIIGGLSHIGIISDIAKVFDKFDNNLFLIFTVIVWGSVLISAVIDNIPYVLTMLPVIATLSNHMPVNHQFLLYFGLLIGATLGGNITPIGASANIAGIGILRKENYEVKTSTFMKISVPFTLTAVIVGYILIWFIWA